MPTVGSAGVKSALAGLQGQRGRFFERDKEVRWLSATTAAKRHALAPQRREFS
jgi:hypothetical protein